MIWIKVHFWISHLHSNWILMNPKRTERVFKKHNIDSKEITSRIDPMEIWNSDKPIN